MRINSVATATSTLCVTCVDQGNGRRIRATGVVDDVLGLGLRDDPVPTPEPSPDPSNWYDPIATNSVIFAWTKWLVCLIKAVSSVPCERQIPRTEEIDICPG